MTTQLTQDVIDNVKSKSTKEQVEFLFNTQILKTSQMMKVSLI